VVAEIRGREHPEEIVLIGAHLDSWDVGAGAVDDGAGCAMVLEAMRWIASGPPPRRTVRAVLFANEENGLRGARAYHDAHLDEMARHVAAVEADSGAARAFGISLRAGDGGIDQLRDALAPALASIGAGRVREGHGGADLSPLAKHGIPRMSLDLESTRYFDWHHTMADTIDKVDPLELQQAAAALAGAAWILADQPGTLPRYTPTEEELDLPKNRRGAEAAKPSADPNQPSRP
jgi:Zn-dependent M28 family amino/carboxypeptidase